MGMHQHPYRQRGAVISEFVLIIPLIAVILALLFYMGGLVVRAHSTSSMVRYEAWRDVERDAPGPAAGRHNELLNHTFFNGRASRIDRPVRDEFFPEAPYERVIEHAGLIHDDTALLADAWFYLPDGEHRQDRGRRVALAVTHTPAAGAWERATSVMRTEVPNPEAAPLRRGHTRIGRDWTYLDDWRAGPPDWPVPPGRNAHHHHAVRDAFLIGFDGHLEASGAAGRDYFERAGELDAPGHQFAATLRGLYLHAPQYRGPKVER